VRILLIQLGAMGDTLLTSPAVRAIRRAKPDATIELLTKRAFASVVETNPNLNGVVTHPGGIRGDFAVAFELRRRGYDAVVDFQSSPHSSVLARLTGAPIRIGADRRHRLGYTQRMRLTGEVPYSSADKLELLGPLGVDSAGLRLDLLLNREDVAYAQSLWRRLGWKDEDAVAVLSPASGNPANRWPPDRFAAVGDRLSRRFSGRLLLFGGPGEHAQMAAVAERMIEPVVVHRSPTSPREAAAVFARSALWVGCDNGGKHLACATGVPTVTLFRAGHAAAFTNPDVPAQWFVEAPSDGGSWTVERLPLEPVLEVVERAIGMLWADGPAATGVQA